jgi:hypothetical protein
VEADFIKSSWGLSPWAFFAKKELTQIVFEGCCRESIATSIGISARYPIGDPKGVARRLVHDPRLRMVQRFYQGLICRVDRGLF